MKKYVLACLAIVAVLVVTGMIYFSKSSDRTADVAPNTSQETAAHVAEPPATNLPAGRYTEYASDKLHENYTVHILFFFAPWCPECRAFENAITTSEIPSGTQILKVDYDTAKDLRQKYGVTIQTTFVRVDHNGDLITKWVGYGKDKSVTAIVENTR